MFMCTNVDAIDEFVKVFEKKNMITCWISESATLPILHTPIRVYFNNATV